MNEFFIVNDFDRPEERNLAAYRDGRYYYVHPFHEGRFREGMISSTATKISDFGVLIKVVGEEVKGEVVKESIATYPSDGSQRRWQGGHEFLFKRLE